MYIIHSSRCFLDQRFYVVLDSTDSASLCAFCGEDEYSGSEDEGEGEAGGDGVALQVEQERGEHVGRLKYSQVIISISLIIA